MLCGSELIWPRIVQPSEDCRLIVGLAVLEECYGYCSTMDDSQCFMERYGDTITSLCSSSLRSVRYARGSFFDDWEHLHLCVPPCFCAPARALFPALAHAGHYALSSSQGAVQPARGQLPWQPCAQPWTNGLAARRGSGHPSVRLWVRVSLMISDHHERRRRWW